MCVLLLLTLLCIATQWRVSIPFGPFCEGPTLLTQSTLCPSSITWLVFNITWHFIMRFFPSEPHYELCVIFGAVFMAEYIGQNTLERPTREIDRREGEVTRCPSDPNGSKWHWLIWENKAWATEEHNIEHNILLLTQPCEFRIRKFHYVSVTVYTIWNLKWFRYQNCHIWGSYLRHFTWLIQGIEIVKAFINTIVRIYSWTLSPTQHVCKTYRCHDHVHVCEF